MPSLDTYLYIIQEAQKGSDMRNALHDAIKTIGDGLEKAESGAPTVVTLASDMTDIRKIYLYTGSESGYTKGDWYYYDGSSFVSGGTYGGAGITIEDDGQGHVSISTGGQS